MGRLAGCTFAILQFANSKIYRECFLREQYFLHFCHSSQSHSAWSFLFTCAPSRDFLTFCLLITFLIKLVQKNHLFVEKNSFNDIHLVVTVCIVSFGDDFKPFLDLRTRIWNSSLTQRAF